MKRLTKRNVIGEIAAIAFSDLSDYVNVESIEDRGQVLTVTDTRLIPKSKRRAICSIKAGTKGIEVKLYDKLKALELVGRICGVFSGSQEAEERELIESLKNILETGDEIESDE